MTSKLANECTLAPRAGTNWQDSQFVWSFLGPNPLDAGLSLKIVPDNFVHGEVARRVSAMAESVPNALRHFPNPCGAEGTSEWGGVRGSISSQAVT
ncbi:hypothetical protein EV696_102199 [Permianibacter aggregans]|uniref:Uncharacterized protein n=1 Tax=Permianibacter aggregans TaxID=1510150 RepID=A0A4V3D871_9GAMM|nr:hypothetical protein EV696_102199 [Permianibacter aggregans]